ncbi:beta-N-acetylhexosaminidase [Streptosporangium roseum]|uniref:beta-N-acetylhexosaminidase n=1 Tax=Streptosporangium roseum (strain ATCC 12428 / DSM 43021 / JCM 3005 / KCTC 9067 / NCIMB 10171 / NRRL 2505 / NI 9100) TaxID=479432 RepID=D2B988_STRRD|nr:beta-N-acetylhexosaminidase [Streptosporangium roseum]ACZ91633.1 Beta-N-acetylhexosaminidase [Streptosporangium roseum DSM 43021]
MTDLLPRPAVFAPADGSFPLSPGTPVSGPAELVDGVRLALAVLDPRPAEAGTIVVERDAALDAEAYTLEVTATGVRITAGDRAGAFYAGQTLRQLLPHGAFRTVAQAGWTVPCGRVEDAPRFSWRGVHLDVARHFLPKREVLRMVDLMAAHKLNRLHLHLVDDQGWRVESRVAPRLHEVASHRPRTITSHHKDDPVYDEVPHGGYYTLDDLAEIAAYARARAVTVVPEIDVPGHASAILAAYPSLDARATGGREPEPFPVLDRWGISPAILSPLPPTVDFLTSVIDEIRGALGETPYVHLGGDECVLDDWAASAEIVAFQEELGLESLSGLHAWFLRRLADLLAERGSRAIVWDEAFVSGMLRPDTIVMPWRGPGVARRAAEAGHDVVQTPVFPLYFDYAETSSEEEPLAIGDAITVSDVATFAPAPESWTAEQREHVLGAQFQLWSERLPDGRAVDYRAWPRGCALAEVVWSGSAGPGFGERLEGHLGRLDALGVEYRPPAGPRPWQLGGTGRRRHRPGVVKVDEVMGHLEEMTHLADSTRPSM